MNLSSFEQPVFSWIQQWKHPILLHFFIVCTQLGTPIGWFFLSVSYTLWLYNIDSGIALGCSALCGGIAAEGMKLLIRRKRPCSLPDGPIAHIKIPQTYSFPSGHACSSATVSSMLYLSNQPYAFLFGCFAFVVGISRIYLGVHYPSDVLVGWMLGTACGAYVAHSLLPLLAIWIGGVM